MDIAKELLVPFLGFLLFFAIQSSRILNERRLTILVCAIAAGTAALSYHRNEWLLFAIGLILGIVIEIGLRRFGYQQTWKDASLFGVPYWLPIIWGFGLGLIYFATLRSWMV